MIRFKEGLPSLPLITFRLLQNISVLALSFSSLNLSRKRSVLDILITMSVHFLGYESTPSAELMQRQLETHFTQSSSFPLELRASYVRLGMLMLQNCRYYNLFDWTMSCSFRIPSQGSLPVGRGCAILSLATFKSPH